MFIPVVLGPTIVLSPFIHNGDKTEVALSNTETECRFLDSELKRVNTKIRDLENEIRSNLEILDSGVGNRVRVRIQGGVINQQPSRNEAEILTRANELRQEIRQWQSEISQLRAERANIMASQRSLGC